MDCLILNEIRLKNQNKLSAFGFLLSLYYYIFTPFEWNTTKCELKGTKSPQKKNISREELFSCLFTTQFSWDFPIISVDTYLYWQEDLELFHDLASLSWVTLSGQLPIAKQFVRCRTFFIRLILDIWRTKGRKVQNIKSFTQIVISF